MRNRTNSLIGLASADELRIALHYKAAAQCLYNSNEFQDHIALPFLFLVRQYLELGLKYNIRKLDEIHPCSQSVSVLTKTHDLNDLYNHFINCYNDTKNNQNATNLSDEPLLKNLDMLIIEISSLDSKSQGFRYSLDKKNQKIIPIEKVFDLKKVFELFVSTSSLITHTEDVFNQNP
jgi:hypothetical protein